ncbi:hypothetical protein K443DRAFT_45500, partial [Laccaria amethystina LaAM-08-1]
MNSDSPSRPNKRPYHTPPPQQHGWPATVDPSTLPALSRFAPLPSPAEVATNNIHNPVQQIPQENVMQSIDGSVVPNDAVGPSVAITRKPRGPSSAPSRNFASRRRLKVPPYSPGVHRPQVPASMGVFVAPHAPPSTSIGVVDLPHNPQTTPSHSASVDMSNFSLPTPTNTMPTPASSAVVIYDPSRTHLATQMDRALTPQSPSPGVIATYDPSHTHLATQAHSHHDHLSLPQFAPPPSAGDVFQAFTDTDFNMDHIGLMSIPGQYDISYDKPADTQIPMASMPSPLSSSLQNQASMSSPPSSTSIPMVSISSSPSTAVPVVSMSPPPSSPLRNQAPMASMSSPPSSPLRMTSPVANMSSATHQAQTPFPINMDTLSDPSSPMLTPVRQNLTAEVPYATP